MDDELLPPDLSDTPTPDLCALMMACGMSKDPSDKMFAKACRDELAKRNPDKNIRTKPIDIPKNVI